MTTPSPSKDRRHARRLLVTLVITTAAAAVTAGVVIKKHQHAEAAVQRADASPMRSGVAPASPAFPRDVEGRDPSVPSAAASLKGAAETAEEPATF